MLKIESEDDLFDRLNLADTREERKSFLKTACVIEIQLALDAMDEYGATEDHETEFFEDVRGEIDETME